MRRTGLGFLERLPGGPGLKKIPVAGGTPVEIVGGDITFRGASWGDDGTIVYATTDPETGLFGVSDAGGTPIVLTTPNKDQREADHVLPFVLPRRTGHPVHDSGRGR